MLNLRKHQWLTILALSLTLGWAGWISCPSGFAATWSKSSITTVQTNLQSKGYYHGKIDGRMGPQTRAALRQYQKAENLPVTGTLDSRTAANFGVRPSSEKGDFKGAAHSVGRGGKEFGHAMKKGKPVKAGVELGKSVGHAGKDVGKGVKKAATPH
jgi:peptidoglycan hydrolase-like protein with peptidoglycan-binding domain